MERLSPAQRKIFDPDSPACHSALQQLAVVLDHLGFTVRKKSPREATLRVYPRGFRRYPLLNPRFTSLAVYSGNMVGGSFLECTVLSKGDDRLDQHLRAFASAPDCEFVVAGRSRAVHFHHGAFVIPIYFAHAQKPEIDFASLGKSIQRMRDYLTTDC